MMTKSRNLEEIYSEEAQRLQVIGREDVLCGEFCKPVFGSGNIAQGIVFVGEAPGAEETLAGQPFVGRAGRYLNKLLEMMGISREDVFMTNVVKYRPVTYTKRGMKNRTPTTKEVLASCNCLSDELCAISPKVVITLGNTPLGAVMHMVGKGVPTIGEAHGKTFHVAIENNAFALVPLYHPASGIYNHALLPVMQDDAKKLGEHLVKLMRDA